MRQRGSGNLAPGIEIGTKQQRPDFERWVLWRQPWNSKRSNRGGDSDRENDKPRQQKLTCRVGVFIGVWGISVVERSADGTSQNYGQIRKHVDRSVRSAQQLRIDNFGQDSIFRGTEESTLGGDQNERTQYQPQIRHPQPSQCHECDNDFR